MNPYIPLWVALIPTVGIVVTAWLTYRVGMRQVEATEQRDRIAAEQRQAAADQAAASTKQEASIAVLTEQTDGLTKALVESTGKAKFAEGHIAGVVQGKRAERVK